MENQTNYSPAPQQSSGSGANTVLLVIIILIILGGGYWWYTHRTPAPADNGGVDINVTLPAGSEQPAEPSDGAAI